MTLSKTQREFHQKMKARCFSEAWEYLEKKNRDSEDDRRMLNLAHAARFHAGYAGTAQSLAIGDWQISRVYAALHQSELALTFAESSLELCRKNGLSDIVCTAYEAAARAHAAGNDLRSATEFITKARRQLDESSVDEESREIFLGQIRETERLIRRARTTPS